MCWSVHFHIFHLARSHARCAAAIRFSDIELMWSIVIKLHLFPLLIAHC